MVTTHGDDMEPPPPTHMGAGPQDTHWLSPLLWLWGWTQAQSIPLRLRLCLLRPHLPLPVAVCLSLRPLLFPSISLVSLPPSLPGSLLAFLMGSLQVCMSLFIFFSFTHDHQSPTLCPPPSSYLGTLSPHLGRFLEARDLGTS